MPSSTVYFGDLLTALDRMGLAGQIATAGHSAEVAEQVGHVAAAFGMEWQIPVPEQRVEDLQPLGKVQQEPQPEPVPSVAEAPVKRQHAEFWTVLRKRRKIPEEVEQLPEELRNVPPPLPDKWTFRGEPRKGAPLMPWSRLWPFLRRVLGHERPSRSPDLPRLVRALALGRPLHRLPRQRRSAWCPEVTILVDRRPAMSPFLDDFEEVIARIRSLRGTGGLRVIPARADIRGLLSDTTLEPLRLPCDASSTALLALGDLGQYAGSLMAGPWVTWGRMARGAGITPWALCPCPQDRWIPSATRAWNVVCWDRHCRPPQDGSGQRALPWADDEQELAVKLRSRQLHDVLRLVSPAIRIERGFLRDVRFLLDHTAADAGTEYDAFQCPDTNGSGNGFSLVPARQRQLRAELGQAVPPPLLAGMLRLLGHHHTYSASIFGAEELEGLKEALPPALWPLLEQSGLLTPDSESQAALHWRQIAAGLLQGGFGRHQEAMKGYAMRGISRVEGSIADSAAKQVIWALNHPDHQGEYPGYVAPLQVAFLQKRNRMPAIHAISFVDGLRVGAVSPHDKIPVASLYTHQSAANVQIDFEAHDWPRKLLWNWQDVPLLSGDELSGVSRIRIDAGVDAVELGKLTRPAWASRMWHENAELKAQFTFKGHNYLFERSWAQELVSQFLAPMGSFYGETGWQLSEWTCKSPPKWATRLWADDYGLAAEFHIRSVPFTLRWIPPGSFLMGSPEGEPGRQKNEGPQHRVTISKGYWMAETPVTQAQWRAVVEAVYGTRAGGGFFSPNKLNRSPSHYKGPAELPVEQVSWEDSTAYCRLLNALLPDGPGFHLPTEAQWEYACRAGTDTAFNDGSGCTLPSGKDPALDRLGWFGDNSGSQTHPVKQKLANRNGLHDMHGNVWEWCADAWYDYSAESATNPRHDGEKGANRVLRGGSWVSHARYCRAAYRCGDRPGARWFGPGLRLAAGQEQAEPQQKERSDLPERRSRARRAGGSKPA